MRLDILNRGYGPGTTLLFALIRVFSGYPAPDAAKLTFYRPGFYGTQAKKFTHEAMRGPSAWSVANRELMAAFVSKVNENAFCVGAHTATATQAYQDAAKVQAVLAEAIQSRLRHATIAETMDTYGHFPDADEQGRGAVDAMFTSVRSRPASGSP